VYFAEGETSKEVFVKTLDNNELESTETFRIFLKSPSTGYKLDKSRYATVTIFDNDEPNQPPTISGDPATQTTAGSAYSFTPSASDPDGDKLSFSVSNLPTWATFDAASGTLAGTPAASDAGLYSNIVISVSDGTDTASLAAFSINVEALQLGGVVGFTSTTASVNEGETVSVTITRSNDADEASVMYGTRSETAISSTLGGDDYAGFSPTSVNFAKGESSKTVSVKTLDNTEVESAETFKIFLKSPSTGYDLDSSSVVTVTIADNDVANQPPTISGTPATQVTEGSAYSFTPSASDADGDKLSFSVSSLPAWASFDAASGTLSGAPAASDAGLYSNIVISVSDGTDTASLAAFSINVDALQLGGVVGFSSTTASVTEGETVNVTITRSNDADEASVVYGTRGVTATSSTAGGDDYAGFSPATVNFAKGETSKVVSVQTLDNTEAESTETFEIFLKSPSTGYELDSSSVVIVTIADNDEANQPPTISGNPATQVTEGSAYSFTPSASDADGDKLSFSVSNLPTWATFDASNGTMTGTPAASDAGLHSNIVISVSDGTDTASLAAFSINVEALELGGLIGFSATTASVNEGDIVYVTITRSNDADEASIEYGTHSLSAVSSTVGGDDYAGFSPTVVNFAKGETSKVVSVQTLDNTEAESTETFEIFLVSPSSGYELDMNSVVTVSIADNDEATTGSVTLNWAAPSTREDGTSLAMSEIAGYKIYMGESSSNLSFVLDINDNSVSTHTLNDLVNGTHYFAITTYDTDGNESGFSNVVEKPIL
jgi:predicted RNA-binding protein with TRAM domain